MDTHGFEEDNGTHFLVLELVDGDTLADRMKRGAIPVEESLKLALQIAEALEAAHEKGVIHRDLKPANVKVTEDGKVKVLDFGLAKAFESDDADVSVSNSPTLSMAATQQGVVLGTAAYMSPEQAKGRKVDRQTDIWAFGCVVYEMLTGRPAFPGEDVTEVLASVIKTRANMELLPTNIHATVPKILSRCLEKDTKKRFRDIGDVQFELEQILADPNGVFVQPVSERAQAKSQSKLPWVVAVVLTGIVVGLAVWNLKREAPGPVGRFSHVLPEGQQFSGSIGPVVAVSPDGSRMVYVANQQLYLRPMDTLESTPILGTDENPVAPFFSPDSEWVGYRSGADEQLKKIAVVGGAPVPLTVVASLPFSISWDVDDTILYEDDGDIMRVPADGGEPEVLIPRLEEARIRYPQLLPGGEAVLFQVEGGQVGVQSLDSEESKILFPGERPRYVSTGHIIYGQADVLFAVPFDTRSLEVTGGQVPLVEGVQPSPMQYAVSDSGSLVYVSASAVGDVQHTLVWVARDGTQRLVTEEKRAYQMPRVAPDGERLALTFTEGSERHAWIYDILRDSFSRLTFEGRDNFPLIWTPDGNWITFQSDRDGVNNLYRQPADGTGPAERLTTNDVTEVPSSWTPDGNILAFYTLGAEQGIWLLPMEGDRTPQPFMSSPNFECCAMFSPDGQWLAYVSDETGRRHVYVRPYPEEGGQWLVSGEEGGGESRWSPDGTELFYRSGDQLERMMAVSVQTEPTFRADTPRMLFEGSYQVSANQPGGTPYYDISPDGQRFLMIDTEAEQGAGAQINIVLNWFQELRERVPVD